MKRIEITGTVTLACFAQTSLPQVFSQPNFLISRISQLWRLTSDIQWMPNGKTPTGTGDGFLTKKYIPFENKGPTVQSVNRSTYLINEPKERSIEQFIRRLERLEALANCFFWPVSFVALQWKWTVKTALMTWQPTSQVTYYFGHTL